MAFIVSKAVPLSQVMKIRRLEKEQGLSSVMFAGSRQEKNLWPAQIVGYTSTLTVTLWRRSCQVGCRIEADILESPI